MLFLHRILEVFCCQEHRAHTKDQKHRRKKQTHMSVSIHFELLLKIGRWWDLTQTCCCVLCPKKDGKILNFPVIEQYILWASAKSIVKFWPIYSIMCWVAPLGMLQFHGIWGPMQILWVMCRSCLIKIIVIFWVWIESSLGWGKKSIHYFKCTWHAG
jgi:hypothetical protein